MAQSADSSWKRLYKAGGASLVLGGFLSFAYLLSFFTTTDTFGLSGEAALKSIASSRSGYLINQGLLRFLFVLLVPGLLALYAAVKDLEKSYALLGLGLLIFSLTQQVLSPIPGALVNLSDKYAAATTDAQRATFSAAAEAVNSLGFAFTAGPLMLGVGLIFISVVTLKGIFHKGVGYLGIASGLFLLLAEVAEVGLGLFIILALLFIIFFVLLAVWSIAVGSKLYRLG